MRKSQTAQGVAELRSVLERMTIVQGSLHGAVRSKLEAMRRADLEGMMAAGRQEGELVSAIAGLDEQRRGIVARLWEDMGLPAAGGKGASLRALGERLDPAGRASLSEAAQRLRESMLKVAEANRVVEMVSREMLEHFKAIFSAMVHEESDGRIYSARGGKGSSGGARVLDAVG